MEACYVERSNRSNWQSKQTTHLHVTALAGNSSGFDCKFTKIRCQPRDRELPDRRSHEEAKAIGDGGLIMKCSRNGKRTRFNVKGPIFWYGVSRPCLHFDSSLQHRPTWRLLQ